ncbi:MAG: DUF483 domain-containing protein [Candidatus Omnitrophica bacterium]|nr:DUF483 domain-containing protein [Candidatus Omnitrophota bacterium]
MYMSLVLGFKPLMDDWIPVKKLAEFRKACHKYKIYMREDVVFDHRKKNEIKSNVLGKDCLTTTCAQGLPFKEGAGGFLHIFLSKDKNILKKGVWYPLVIKNRVIFQPRIDNLKYGYVLGYPDCCVKFFSKFNNWKKYSFLYEAYKNTRNKPSFLCNPFLKATSFSYIFHMPCSYSCKNTISLVNNLRKEIKKKEPYFVALTDSYLKSVFLVFYEDKSYCFDGDLKDDLLRYRTAYYTFPGKTKDIYGKNLKKADSLKLESRKLILYHRNKVNEIIDVPMNSTAPEFPFLIKFS